MNNSDLAKEISKEFKLPILTSKKLLSFTLKTIAKNLVFGKNVTLAHLGSFKLFVRKPKTYKHVKTKEILTTKKCYGVRYTISKPLNERIKAKKVY